MADIVAIIPGIAGATAAFAATTPAGDLVAYPGGDILVEFDNTSVASITISVVPTQTTGLILGAGVAPVPTRSVAVAAGAHAAFFFKHADIIAYLTAAKKLPFTYATGDAGLLIRAFSVK